MWFYTHTHTHTHTHTVEYCPAIEKMKSCPFRQHAWTWENITLSEIDKDKYLMISLICEIKKWNITKYIDSENKLLARGKRFCDT